MGDEIFPTDALGCLGELLILGLTILVGVVMMICLWLALNKLLGLVY